MRRCSTRSPRSSTPEPRRAHPALASSRNPRRIGAVYARFQRLRPSAAGARAVAVPLSEMPVAGGSQNAPERTGAPAPALRAAVAAGRPGGLGLRRGRRRLGGGSGVRRRHRGEARVAGLLGATAASASGSRPSSPRRDRPWSPRRPPRRGRGLRAHSPVAVEQGLRPRRRSCDSAGNPAVTSTLFAASRAWPTTFGTVALGVAEPTRRVPRRSAPPPSSRAEERP